MFKFRRALVTGGSGFIGSHLVKRLLSEGCVTGITARYANPIKCERLKSVWNAISVIEADLRNRGALEAIMQEFDPDVVFHLAAYNHVGESFHQVEEVFDVNAKGTANLFDSLGDLKANGIKFVYVSSSEVYGRQKTVPWNEEMVPNPISPYSITKYAGELYCRMKQRMGEPVSIVRPFNTYGPYQSAKAVIPELILKCLRGETIRTTSGKQTREFNFVDDTVEGLIRAAEADYEGPINIACGYDIAIRDLVLMIHKMTKSKSKLEIGVLRDRPTEIWQMRADNSKCRETISWTPEADLLKGLGKTIKWFRENREKVCL